jgi:hypothetical protein
MRITTLRPLAGAIVSLLGLFSLCDTALAVVNGIETNGRPNTVFMATMIPDEEIEGHDHIGVGTITAVKYPRCMITAKHVMEGGLDVVVKGRDLRDITSSTYRQKIATWKGTEALPVYVSKKYRDIAVAWMENKSSDTFYGVNRITRDMYEPLALATPTHEDNLGLEPNTSGETSEGGPKVVLVEGYGVSGTVDGKEVGQSVKRVGYPHATLFRLGVGTPGSYIKTVARAGDGNRIGCAGDSGAALTLSGSNKVVGILSSGSEGNEHCGDETVAFYSAFDHSNYTDDKTNWTRVNELVKTTCGVNAMGFKAPQSIGQGYVVGSLSSPQEWPPIENDLQFNDAIFMGDSTPNQDFREFIHEGQDMVLNAIPSPGSYFMRWEQYGINTPYGNCPCYGSSNPVCIMEYDQVGYYDEDTSLDVSTCLAKFGIEGSSSSSSTSSSSSYSSSVSSSSSDSSFSSSSVSSTSSSSWSSSVSSSSSESSAISSSSSVVSSEQSSSAPSSSSSSFSWPWSSSSSDSSASSSSYSSSSSSI